MRSLEGFVYRVKAGEDEREFYSIGEAEEMVNEFLNDGWTAGGIRVSLVRDLPFTTKLTAKIDGRII